MEDNKTAAPEQASAFGSGGVDWSNAGVKPEVQTPPQKDTPPPDAQKEKQTGTATPPEKPAAETDEQVPDIQNPQAYIKAMEDKYQRLISKRDEKLTEQQTQIERLQSQLNGIEEGKAKSFGDELSELKKSVEEERAAAQKERAEAQKATLEALRVKVVTELGLPLELAQRLNGSTESELRADAEKLAAIIPKRQGQQRPPLGNNTSDPQADLKWFLEDRGTFGRGGVYTQGE